MLADYLQNSIRSYWVICSWW